jgi:hypothetical protein
MADFPGPRPRYAPLAVIVVLFIMHSAAYAQTKPQLWAMCRISTAADQVGLIVVEPFPVLESKRAIIETQYTNSLVYDAFEREYGVGRVIPGHRPFDPINSKTPGCSVFENSQAAQAAVERWSRDQRYAPIHRVKWRPPEAVTGIQPPSPNVVTVSGNLAGGIAPQPAEARSESAAREGAAAQEAAQRQRAEEARREQEREVAQAAAERRAVLAAEVGKRVERVAKRRGKSVCPLPPTAPVSCQ